MTSSNVELAATARRFLTVGAANFALTYALYLVMLPFVAAETSYFLAFILGLAFNYVCKSAWVFEKRMSVRTFAKYTTYYIFYSLLGMTLIYISINFIGLREEFAPLLTITILTPIHFWGSRAVLRVSQPEA